VEVGLRLLPAFNSLRRNISWSIENL